MGFDIFPEIKPDSGLGLIFLFGVIISFHCAGMCGGFVVSQSIAEDGKTKKSVYFNAVLYNISRILSYAVTGAVAGGAGKLLTLPAKFGSIIPLIGGIFLIIMGINLSGITSVFRHLNLRFPKFIFKLVSSDKKKTPVVIGLLSGLMPCAPLQIVQIYAVSSGSIIHGALAMALFGIGTIPMMFMLGALSTIFNKKRMEKIVKAGSIIVIIMGISMVGRGLAISGVDINIFKKFNFAYKKSETTGSNIQNIVTTVHPEKFDEISVKKGIPVRWIIKASKKDLNGCSSTFLIPDFNIKIKIKEGDNIVTFLPEKEGDYVYSSWCAMITSRIHVTK